LKSEYIRKAILYSKILVFLLRGLDIPTVHISLPSKTYEELKMLASSMGVQVTDVIKMFIREGLHGDIRNRSPVVEAMRNYESEITFLKGKVYLLEQYVRELLDRLERIEERIDELESPDILLRGRRYGGRINKS